MLGVLISFLYFIEAIAVYAHIQKLDVLLDSNIIKSRCYSLSSKLFFFLLTQYEKLLVRNDS